MAGLVDETLIQLVVQAGALGVLVFVLYFVMRWWIRKSDDEFAARVAHDKIEQQCRTDRDNFIEGLVNAHLEQQEIQMSAWQTMTGDTLQAFRDYTGILHELTASLKESRQSLRVADQRIQTKHAEIHGDVQKLVMAVDQLERAVSE